MASRLYVWNELPVEVKQFQVVNLASSDFGIQTNANEARSKTALPLQARNQSLEAPETACKQTPSPDRDRCPDCLLAPGHLHEDPCTAQSRTQDS